MFQTTAETENPLKKREDFAVSLRKQKKTELIRKKRMRLVESAQASMRYTGAYIPAEFTPQTSSINSAGQASATPGQISY